MTVESPANRYEEAKARYNAIVWGLLMIVGGVGLMLHNAGVVNLWSLRLWWPVLLFVPAGEAIVAAGGGLRGWLTAVLWGGGAVLLLLHLHDYPVLRLGTVVALLLIVLGARLLWRPRVDDSEPGRSR